MNLQEYFNQQKNICLSVEKKTELFSRIQQQRQQKTLNTKSFFFSFNFSYKRISYTCLAIIVCLFVFGGVMLERNGGIDNIFFSSDQGNNSVYAGYVAEVIEFSGERYLQNGDQVLSSQYIQNGDTLYLKEGSEIVFNLNDSSQAKIIGPATVSISKNKDNTYKIILTEGNFFKIFNETPENEIEIITEDITITSQKKQPLDLQIAKDGNETMIKNNGGDTKITSQKNNTTVEKTLTKETVSIKGNDINVITDTESFTNFLKRNNISETLNLSANPQTTQSSNETGNTDNQIQLNSDIEINLPEITEIITPNIEDNTNNQQVNDEIKSELGLGNETKIPTPAQSEVLRTSLNSFFLMNNFEKITKAVWENNETKTQEGIKDLSNKINTLLKTLNLDTKTITSLSDIKQTSLFIKNYLEENYYIAPSQLQQLEKIAHRCDYLASLQTNETEQTTQELRDNFKTSLPSNLFLN